LQIGTKLDNRTEVAQTTFILENSTSSIVHNRGLNMLSWPSLAEEAHSSPKYPSALNSLFKLPDL